jgi:hypothetical protein
LLFSFSLFSPIISLFLNNVLPRIAANTIAYRLPSREGHAAAKTDYGETKKEYRCCCDSDHHGKLLRVEGLAILEGLVCLGRIRGDRATVFDAIAPVG